MNTDILSTLLLLAGIFLPIGVIGVMLLFFTHKSIDFSIKMWHGSKTGQVRLTKSLPPSIPPARGEAIKSPQRGDLGGRGVD